MIAEKDKTPMMKLLELRHGMSIEDILMSDSVIALAKATGVNKATISKWLDKILPEEF